MDRLTVAPAEPFWCGSQYAQQGIGGSGGLSGSGVSQVKVSPGLLPLPPQTGGDTVVEWWLKRSAERPPQSDMFDHQIIGRVTRLAMAEADGSWVAGPLRNGIAMTAQEAAEAPYDLWNESDKDGVFGFYRLGLAFLGGDAFKLAEASPRNARLYVPFCDHANLVPMENMELAVTYLEVVASCISVSGKPDTLGWMDNLVAAYPGRAAEIKKWQDNATTYADRLMEKHGLDPESDKDQKQFCTGFVDPDGPTSSRASCPQATMSRQALKLGDAEFAVSNKERARACWRKAIDLAKESPDGAAAVDPDGVTAAILAQKRLQTHDTTCKWTPDSLSAISRDYKARSGDLIHVKVLQQALKSLGHYDGDFDGELTPATRAAIRKYQREREEDETDTLTPEQIVTLICNSAEGPGNEVAQTTLGIMYVTGLGVEQNMDRAQYWLNLASNQGHYADATYNLAIVFGTGIILDSYRLCDVPRSPEQAERYLKEAAAQGHPIASALMQMYGPGSKYASLTPRERWALIEMQQLENSLADKTGLYAHRISPIGTKCSPDRATR